MSNQNIEMELEVMLDWMLVKKKYIGLLLVILLLGGCIPSDQMDKAEDETNKDKNESISTEAENQSQSDDDSSTDETNEGQVEVIPEEPWQLLLIEEGGENVAYKFGLSDVDGEMVIDYEYDYITYIEGTSKLLVSKGETYQILDMNTLDLSKAFGFSEQTSFVDALAHESAIVSYLDEESMKYGYKRNGEVYVEAIYDDASTFKDGYAVVGMTEDYEWTYQIVDEAMTVHYEQDLRIYNYGYGLFGLVQEFDNYNETMNHVVVVDYRGEQVIDGVYFEVDVLSDELILLADHLEGKLVDYSGNEVEFEFMDSASSGVVKEAILNYQNASLINDYLILMMDWMGNNDYIVIDIEGNLIMRVEADASDSIVALKDGLTLESVNLMDKRFNQVSIPKIIDGDGGNRFAGVNRYFDNLYKPELYLETKIEEIYEEYSISHDHSIIGDVLEINMYYYWYGFGAAHPNHYSETLQIDMSTGKFLELDDLIAPSELSTEETEGSVEPIDLYDMLTAIVKDMALEDKDAYFDVDNIVIDKNANYHIDREGITIYFSPYEIAAYAAGYPEFRIEFVQLEGIDYEGSIYYQLLSK